jgi:DNA repair protein RadD
MYKLRDYQEHVVSKAISFFEEKKNKSGILVLPTGSGKSLVIAELANRIGGSVLIFQPSKEILEQNYEKYISYGNMAGIFSASAGSKDVQQVTFAMIGSVMNRMDMFKHFETIIIDECHLVNSSEGMYAKFLSIMKDAKIIGLTATPYRLSSSSFGSELKFLTRTREKVFKQIISLVQNDYLFKAGHLAKLKYYEPFKMDVNKLKVNSTGSEYTDDSMKKYFNEINFEDTVAHYAERVLAKRKNLLVFTRFIWESEYVKKKLGKCCEVVTGDTPKKEREKILSDFKSGKIKVVCNVGVLTTGFDFPELEAVLICRPTMSLSLYYQMVGRSIRPHAEKDEAWIVDLCGNIDRFGKVEDLKICFNEKNLPAVFSNGRQLTNTLLVQQPRIESRFSIA